MSPLFTFRPKKTYLFSPTRERAMWYCRRTGIQPHSRDVYIFTGMGDPASYRGFRIDPKDRVIVLEDFWMSNNADEIAKTFQPSGLNLWTIPVQASRHVA